MEPIWWDDSGCSEVGNTVIGMARYCAKELKIGHIMIDNLSKCVRGEDDYNAQKSFVEELAAIARDHNVHVHLAHHLKKLSNSKEGDTPDKYDAKGSGSITDTLAPEVDVEQCLLVNEIPTCPHCGGMARPNVLMFNDWGWLENRQTQQAACVERWLSGVSRPVVVEIGAGTAIPSVRRFSQRILHEFGGRLVRINPREFSVPSTHDVGLASGACHVLAEIGRVLRDSSS